MKVLVVLSAVLAVAFAYGETPMARTLSQSSDVKPDGSYDFEYTVDNGIAAQESGVGGQYATGRAAWNTPEGVPVAFTYTADETGYHPEGEFVPKTPEYIVRALEYIRSHPVYEDEYTKAVPQVKVAKPFKPVAAPVKPFAPKAFGGNKFGKF